MDNGDGRRKAETSPYLIKSFSYDHSRNILPLRKHFSSASPILQKGLLQKTSCRGQGSQLIVLCSSQFQDPLSDEQILKRSRNGDNNRDRTAQCENRDRSRKTEFCPDKSRFYSGHSSGYDG
ncbi:hypothetical protein K1719_031003 [Acacia pycnantha]|nr:hypothetical protein K1719_031003 [Acacia pycnantha]